jgi:ubiquinol-cytochrome c reductase cytochrome b subunit
VKSVIFTALAAYPAAERFLVSRRGRRDALGRPETRSRAARGTSARGRLDRPRGTFARDVLDRPRETPVKTAVAVAGVTFYGLLWAAAANDQIAHQFHLTVDAVTIFFRFAVVIGPVVGFVITRSICLALQQTDRLVAEHGMETGIITRAPDGGFHERLAPVRQALPGSGLTGPPAGLSAVKVKVALTES